MNIFVSASDKDKLKADELVSFLREKDFNTSYSGDLSAGEDINKYFRKKIIKSDAHIILYTKNSINSRGIKDELIASEALQSKDDQLVIIPIIFDKIEIEHKKRKSIRINDTLDKELNNIFIILNTAKINKLKKQQERDEMNSAILESAKKYVTETKNDLERREKWFSRIAISCSIAGLIFLIIGVIIGYSIYNDNKDLFNSAQGHFWELIVSMTLKGAIIIVLLISASRYCFNLGKTYMNESLKNSDRRHALGFGEIYLERFGAQITQNDFREAFRDWNYNSKSSFLDLSSKDFDPELLSNLAKVAESINKKTVANKG